MLVVAGLLEVATVGFSPVRLAYSVGMEGSGNFVLELVSLIIALYSIVVFYNAASHFNRYDPGGFGVSLTVAKILVGGVILSLLGRVGLFGAPGVVFLLGAVGFLLLVIGELGIGYSSTSSAM